MRRKFEQQHFPQNSILLQFEVLLKEKLQYKTQSNWEKLRKIEANTFIEWKRIAQQT